jgi:DNA modification methylase
MIINGNNIEELKKFDDNYFDSIVTDPPYEIGFMGKSWDASGIANNPEMWSECLRVLKPGGYLLSFSATRTYHRMAVAIEDSGFEIRDMIEWVYGSGFPKSLNIHKQNGLCPEGWGTALKPAHEPICMARKPLAEKTVAENVLKYGTGGINIDESRVESNETTGWNGLTSKEDNRTSYGMRGTGEATNSQGRFPANLIHDNSEEVRECFPETGKGGHPQKANESENNCLSGKNYARERDSRINTDSGNASRFFKSIIYQAKASKKERNAGLDGFEDKLTQGMRSNAGPALVGDDESGRTTTKNNHPTVKPVALMEYLIKMVTPTNGIVLDPFMGSGSTGVACVLNDFEFVGIDLDKDYCEIARARIEGVKETQTKMF